MSSRIHKNTHNDTNNLLIIVLTIAHPCYNIAHFFTHSDFRSVQGGGLILFVLVLFLPVLFLPCFWTVIVHMDTRNSRMNFSPFLPKDAKSIQHTMRLGQRLAGVSLALECGRLD